MTISVSLFIVNDIRNFAFGLANASVYGIGKNRKQKFVMSFTIAIGNFLFMHEFAEMCSNS